MKEERQQDKNYLKDCSPYKRKSRKERSIIHRSNEITSQTGSVKKNNIIKMSKKLTKEKTRQCKNSENKSINDNIRPTNKTTNLATQLWQKKCIRVSNMDQD